MHPTKIKTLIVDDEALAREGLRLMAAGDAEIQIVGECANGKDAVAALRAHAPDLLLLDVQMPEMNGFEVLQHAGVQPLPVVIFVTAYDRYAIRAFEAQALDYLLKPVSDETRHRIGRRPCWQCHDDADRTSGISTSKGRRGFYH